MRVSTPAVEWEAIWAATETEEAGAAETVPVAVAQIPALAVKVALSVAHLLAQAVIELKWLLAPPA